ncbi:MAG: hypothetical protein QOJ50_103, partial [Cryptosporangiaceae bacterium]|nr:hypothetical protein [Cryptosporangiaceae bacterium]
MRIPPGTLAEVRAVVDPDGWG